jgi:hypothetical protein
MEEEEVPTAPPVDSYAALLGIDSSHLI